MTEIKRKENRGFLRRLRRFPRTWIGGGLVSIVILSAVLAPILSPADPLYQARDGLSQMGTPLPPSAQFPLGTDHLGRDMLSRLLYGARISMFISLSANIVALIIGTGVGMVAGYYGGFWDTVIMRFVDVLLAYPAVLLALGLGSVLQPSVRTVFLILMFITWPWLARIIRAQVLSVRELTYVESARAIGCSDAYILLRHILPQVITIAVVWATLSFANTVLIESALSYLGVGVPLPTPSWGNMIAEGQTRYRIAAWMILVPTGAIVITTLGFNLLGDAIRDALDPRTSSQA